MWIVVGTLQSIVCSVQWAVTGIELYLVPWSLLYFDFMSIWLESRWGQGIPKPLLTKALI